MSRFYVSVVDDSRDPPVPVLVTRDPDVLRAVERAIGRRFREGNGRDPDPPLRLLDEDGEDPTEDPDGGPEGEG